MVDNLIMDVLTLSPQEVRLKVLEMARSMLHDAYVDAKAQRHNEWCARAEVAWKTPGVRIPYPGFPEYFTEQDVVHKAQVLLQFVFSTQNSVVEESSQPISEPTETEIDSPALQQEQPTQPLSLMDAQMTEPQSELMAREPVALDTTTEPEPDTEPVRKTLRLLPNWRSRSQ